MWHERCYVAVCERGPVSRVNERKYMIKTIEIEAKVKAFTGQGARSHKLSVSPDGTVRVYDSIAGHYTTVHAMSAATQSRVRKLAIAQ